jgi:Flp pilus assembly pilin Flp
VPGIDADQRGGQYLGEHAENEYQAEGSGGGGRRPIIVWMPMRLESQTGQTTAEYSIVLAVITIAAVLAFAVLSGSIVTAIDAATAIVGS